MSQPADQPQRANAQHVPLLHREYDRRQRLLGIRRQPNLMRVMTEHPLAVARFGGALRLLDWPR